MIDKKAIEEHIRGILIALGEHPDRDGLRETPKRVTRMYEEVFEGIQYSNHEIAEKFGKLFDTHPDTGTVVVRDIGVFSYCEHHMALMYNMHVNVAYIPKGRITGLSKIARVVDIYSHRLQVQERLTEQIKDCIEQTLHPMGVMVVVEARHM